MTAFRRFTLRLLSFFRLTSAEADLAREINSHLQLLEDEFVAKGLTRGDARLAARRAFGGVEQAKEHQRDARGFRWLENSRIDFKLGARMLRKYPGLSLIGGAGLAVGVAMATAFFAFFYSYIYATIPAPDGHRIVGLENWDVKTNNEMRQSAHDFVTWRDEMKTVEELGAFRTIGRNLVVSGASPEPVRLAEITAAGLGVPHIPPRLGRLLTAADEAPGASPVLVIGSDVWASRFASDPSIVGRTVQIGNAVHTIVGVMPEGFEFPISHSYWKPLHLEPEAYPRRQGPEIFIFGRLAPGATMEQAQAELTTLAARASTQFPDTHEGLRARVMPYAHPILDIQGITSWQFAMMQFTVSLLLVIVALNVAILIYARTATRQGEIAVRTALGASRRRLVAQLFIEALLLCGLSAVAGIFLARVGIRMGHAIMETEVGRLPYFIDDGIPAPAYLYVVLLTLAAAVIAGVVPALHATGRRMQTTLKEFGSSSGLRLGGTWTTLIVAQVALAVAGLPIAVASFWGEITYTATTPTFESAPYLSARLSGDPEPPPGMDPDTYRRDVETRLIKLRTDLAGRLEAEPAVEDVTVALGIPGDEFGGRVEVDQQSSTPHVVDFNRVSIDYFDAFGARLITGRLLTASDAISDVSPIVVNQTFVRKILGGQEPIGRRIRYTSGRTEELEPGEPRVDWQRADLDTERWHEIVGVVSDLHVNDIDPDLIDPLVLHPLSQSTTLPVAVIVRVRGRDAAAFSDRLRAITMSLDPGVRLGIFPFSEMQRQQQLALRLLLLALSLIAMAVLLLSAAGIYALMSFTVSRRRKEIGIRAAMGADGAQLLRGVFSRSAAQLGLGVAVGAGLALLIDVLSGGEVLGSAGRMILPVMAVVMIAVGLIASIGPARRGLKIQPTEALRAE
jgi:putative ABC transport system permease protein